MCVEPIYLLPEVFMEGLASVPTLLRLHFTPSGARHLSLTLGGRLGRAGHLDLDFKWRSRK